MNSLKTKYGKFIGLGLCVAWWAFSAELVMAQCDPPALDVTLTFNQPDDYRKADRSAVAAIDWLAEYPLTECEDDRNRLNAYVLVWLSGHPDVTVNLETKVFPFLTDHPELLFPVLFAMGKYVLLNQNDSNVLLNQHVAGLEAVLKIADTEKNYRSDPTIKSLRKMRRKDHLTSYVNGLISP